MNMRSLELEILNELRQVAGNPGIRLKDIMEWSTGEVKAQEGETLFYLPELYINVSVKLPAKKVRPTKRAPDSLKAAETSQPSQSQSENESPAVSG